MGQSQPKLGNTISNILIKTIDSIMGWAYPEGGVAVKAKTGKINNKIFISYCQKVVMSTVTVYFYYCCTNRWYNIVSISDKIFIQNTNVCTTTHHMSLICLYRYVNNFILNYKDKCLQPS